MFTKSITKYIFTNYIYVVGNKDPEESKFEEFKYKAAAGGWNNTARDEALSKAKAKADDLRKQGYRCHIFHKLTVLIEGDDE